MVTYKTFNNIVLDIINYLRLVQPSLDIKPASVARDLFVDAQSQQIANIYTEIKNVSMLQSIANLTGQDLVNYGSNFNLSKQAGTKSIGTAVLTFKTIDSDIPIPQNSVVRTRNGIPFLTVSNTAITATQANSLKATATRLRQQLNTAGITDEFALEVSVQAQSTGSIGNISAYSIVSNSISDVSNVTNVSPFTGGTDAENDSSFKARILATFSGSNVGTSSAYRSIILNLANAIDALVIEPGDPLMTRDGTVTTTINGISVVSKPGTGGRVDIYVMGTNTQAMTDSFVYYDKSGTGEPTASDNDFILGQSSDTASTDLTINSRRVLTLSEGAQIPYQPVSKITSVSGSLSGTSFVEQYLDTTTNQYIGNYKLLKDTGSVGGSAFGMDKISWTDNKIELLGEAVTKNSFNSVDGLAYTDVLTIPNVSQNIQVINENSTISTSRDYITTKHVPIKSISRVFNLTTGERYVIIDQNPDGTSELNTTGRVQISGSTLPTSSDILQVDYNWYFSYDQYIDFDNLDPIDILDSAQDSVEWGYSNYIRDEISQTNLDSYNNLTVNTIYPISRILSVNTYITETINIGLHKTVTVSNAVANIHSIKDNSISGTPEVYVTKENDGTFSNLLITLPTDTLASVGDSVTVVYNLYNIAAVDGYDAAAFVNSQIYIYPSVITSTATPVRVNYVANIPNILSAQIINLPISGNGLNSFVGYDGYQPILNTFSGSTIITNQRRSPSNLVLTLSNIAVTGGTIKMVGTTINKITGVAILTNNTIDLYQLIKAIEGTVSSNTYIAKVAKIQKVSTTLAGIVSTIDYEYDLINYKIKNAKWDRANAIEKTSLSATVIELSSTDYNLAEPFVTGTKLQVSFYYAKENDYESLYFSRNGKVITNKKFGYVSSINRTSGFKDSGGTITGNMQIDNMNQPSINEAYLVDYNYTAPKENERITINYEYNKLITDSTTAIEEKRPITADVLVKEATTISIDVTVAIIVQSTFKDQESTVKQDVTDNITASLSATSLGTTVDSSDIVNNIYNVAGVDRVNVTRFNKTNEMGTKLSITAQKNQYIIPGIITVTTEQR